MESLPVELIRQICSLLCLHCRYLVHFPHADTEDVRLDKASLARLCRTSKSLCAVAQPVLFHYYATGNYPVAKCLGIKEDSVEYPEDDTKLPQFCYALIQQPGLAACVKAVQFCDYGKIDINKTRELLPLLNKTCEELNIKTVVPPERMMDFTKKTSGVNIRLVNLILALAPNVEMALFARDYDPDWSKDFSRQLLSLKTVAFRGLKEDYHICEGQRFFELAPNLQTLYAIGCGGESYCSLFGQYHYTDTGAGNHYYDPVEHLDPNEPWDSHMPWDLGLSKLRKLVLSHQYPNYLWHTVARCPELRDLEYYNWGPVMKTPVQLQALRPTRSKLRRLCFAFVAEHSDPEWEPLPFEYALPHERYPTIPSLREFEQLEELMIDQAHLYCRGDDESPERLTNLLPPSICTLHLAYVYRGFAEELKHLAAEAAQGSFPNLTRVKIGLAEYIAKNRVAEIKQIRVAAQAAFPASGRVQLQWGLDKPGARFEPLIPGANPRSAYVLPPSMTKYQREFTMPLVLDR